ncbi:hypothetical protein [uncultured Paraburkholderia sp.]|nr:hypothetical protein [uncultured Paraburkholderia sp.]
MLADERAQVTKIEPPGGELTRHRDPIRSDPIRSDPIREANGEILRVW